MKTSLRTPKFKTVSLALAAAAALTASSALADTMSVDVVPVGFTLNLTENSSTSLTQTYNGTSTFTITPLGPDLWTLTVATGNCTFFLPLSNFWVEPENSLEFNEVKSTSQTSLRITSDESLFAIEGISFIVPDGTPLEYGTDNGQPLFIRFVDLAAQNEANGVPEGGSTLALSAASLIGLVGLSRFRRLRFA